MALIGAGVVAASAALGGVDITPSSRALYDLMLLGFAAAATHFIFRASVGVKRDGRVDLFELPVWFTLNVLVFLGLSARLAFEEPAAMPPGLVMDYRYLNLALLYVMVGTVALWVGYSIDLAPAIRLRSSRSAPRVEAGAQPGRVLVVYGVSLLGRVLLMAMGGFYHGTAPSGGDFGSLAQWPTYVGQASWLVLAIVGLQATRGGSRFPWRRWLKVVVLVEVSLAGMASIKGQLIPLFVIMLACGFHATRRLSWKPIAALVVLLVVMAPADAALRLRSGSAELSGPERAATMAQLYGEAWLERPLSDTVTDAANMITGRQSGLLQSFSLAVRLTPAVIPHQYSQFAGSYLLLPLVVLIPRAIWPEKPAIGELAGWFTRVYMERDVGGTAITPFGDLYITFGLLGILLGMAFLGVFYRVLYSFLRESGSSSLTALYIGLLPLATSYESSFGGIVQSTLQGLVVFYLLVRFIYRHQVTLPVPWRARPGSPALGA